MPVSKKYRVAYKKDACLARSEYRRNTTAPPAKFSTLWSTRMKDMLQLWSRHLDRSLETHGQIEKISTVSIDRRLYGFKVTTSKRSIRPSQPAQRLIGRGDLKKVQKIPFRELIAELNPFGMRKAILQWKIDSGNAARISAVKRRGKLPLGAALRVTLWTNKPTNHQLTMVSK